MASIAVKPVDPPPPPQAERTPDPCVIVIFGASGDLTKRKLLPALYHLVQSGLLPEKIAVVGVARRPLEDSFAADMKAGIIEGGGVEESDPKLAPFVDKIKYHTMNFDDASGYDSLNQQLSQIDRQYGTCSNRLFYLATAPEYFSDIIKFLGEHGMNKPPPRPSPTAAAPGSASSSRSPSATTSTPPAPSTTKSTRSSTKIRSSASTTTSAKKLSRTSSSSASPTASSKTSGTATTSTT